MRGKQIQSVETEHQYAVSYGKRNIKKKRKTKKLNAYSQMMESNRSKNDGSGERRRLARKAKAEATESPPHDRSIDRSGFEMSASPHVADRSSQSFGGKSWNRQRCCCFFFFVFFEAKGEGI